LISYTYTPDEVQSIVHNGYWAVWNPNATTTALNNHAKKTGLIGATISPNTGNASTSVYATNTSATQSRYNANVGSYSSKNINSVRHTVTHYNYATESQTVTITYTQD